MSIFIKAIATFILASAALVSGVFIGHQNQAPNTGATLTIPTSVALFETSLASKITPTATSMTLVSALDKTGTALASSTYGFILDEGLSTEEMVLADCTSTVCTNMTRGISPLTGTSTVAALEFEHRRGASVKITDGPQLLILTRLVNGIGTFPNILSYKTGTACTGASSNSAICDKAYVDGVAVAGASNANETTKGIVELATAQEQASSTSLGSTLASLVLQAKYATDTPQVGCASGYSAVAGAGCAGILDLTGHWIKTMINQAVTYTWTALATFTGGLTATATTTLAASNVNSNALVLNGIPYKFPASLSSGALQNLSLQTDSLGNTSWAPAHNVYSEFNTAGGTATNAYSTTTIGNVGAGWMTASSTIEIAGPADCIRNSSTGGNCTVFLRDATGATFASFGISSVSSVNGGTDSNGIFTFKILPVNSVSSQRTLYNCSIVGSYLVSAGVDGLSGCRGGGSATSAINLANATTLNIVLFTDSSQATADLGATSIIIHQ